MLDVRKRRHPIDFVNRPSASANLGRMALQTVGRSFLRRLLSSERLSVRKHCSGLQSGEAAAATAASERRIVPVTFSSGLLRFKLDQDTYVLHYWTPVSHLPEVIQLLPSSSQVVSDTLTATQEATMSATPTTPEVRVVDVADEVVDLSATPLALGQAFKDSSIVVIEGIGQHLCLQLDGLVGPLRKWEAADARPKTQDSLLLEQQREALLTSYQPLSAQFTEILSKAESEAHTRFKWGGLFFLSAQLGFVARCTWFEYSWDIMEPITWCITYSLMISTFAYYVMTSQEFMLPMAEKRAVQERFWKLVKKHNFNVPEFRRLRKQLLTLEQRRALTGDGKQTAFDRVMRAMQS